MTPSVPRPTIMVVEDKRELREVLRRTLSENGYLVLTAEDGAAGLEASLAQHPDLVILDVGLPVRDGLDVARELRTRGFRAPVLMLTAHTAVPDRLAGFDAGADDYLGKPFEPRELLARIRNVLRRTEALPANLEPLAIRRAARLLKLHSPCVRSFA